MHSSPEKASTTPSKQFSSKDEQQAIDAGLEQAKSYAVMLDVPFAYSSNGHGFVEFDFFSNKSLELSTFPSPEQLWHRWEQYRRLRTRQLPNNRAADAGGSYTTKLVRQNNPFLYPFCPASSCGKEVRYFQEVVIRRVIERMMAAQRRILLTMATGTDEIHILSDAYEDLLKRLVSENKMAGELYTPRPIIRFVVEVIDPQIGETVYDPFCVSCGFLVEAYLRMQKQEKTIKDGEILQYQTFVGQEKKPIPALIGLMNLVLHGVISPDIRRRNTLEEDVRNISERFDIVLTNPPFGSTENSQIQQNFPWGGATVGFRASTQPTRFGRFDYL